MRRPPGAYPRVLPLMLTGDRRSIAGASHATAAERALRERRERENGGNRERRLTSARNRPKIVRTAVPLDDCWDGSTRVSKTEREWEEKTTGFENDSERCPPRRAGGQAYIHVDAVSASSSLYSNGDLGGAGDGE